MDEITEALHIHSTYLLQFLSAFKALLFVKLYCLEVAIRERSGTLANKVLPVSTGNFLCVGTDGIMSVIESHILKAYVSWRFVSKYSVLYSNCAWTMPFILILLHPWHVFPVHMILCPLCYRLW